MDTPEESKSLRERALEALREIFARERHEAQEQKETERCKQEFLRDVGYIDYEDPPASEG